MGYLFHILLAVGAQALGEANLGLGIELPLLVPLLGAIPYLLVVRTRRLGRLGKFKRAGRALRALQHSAPILHFVAVGGLGWVDSVRLWTGARLDLFGWPEPAMLLAIAPYVVFELLAIDAHPRANDMPQKARRNMRAFQVRMFLSGLLPLFLYLVVAWGIGASDVLRVHIERVAVWNAVFVVALLTVLALFLPALLKNTWETVRLDSGPQRAMLDVVAQRAGFNCRELLMWKTGNMMANAAIVGFAPGRRVVLFSDSLLDMLGLRELAAVFAHEIGHAVRHHVFIFLAWALAIFLGGDLIATYWLADASGGEWTAGGAALAILAVWYCGFGWLSRRFECEADLYSVELLGDHSAMISALERVGGRLRDVAGWRHFSTADRVAFLERAVLDPAFAARFRRRLRFWALLGIVLAVTAAGFQGRDLLQSYPEDRLQVDLSLGDYARAAQRAAGMELDPEIKSLVELASSMSVAAGGAVKIEDLDAALRAALDARQLGRALALSELAYLRAGRGFEAIAYLLEDLIDNDTESARARLDDVPGDWRERMAPLLDQ
jgi:Zn-dependent protease with chaperone function